MSVVNLAVEPLSPAGLDPTRTGSLSTDNQYYFPNNGMTLLHFQKSGATNCTVTIHGLDAGDDIEVVVPATTGDVMIGPIPPTKYNDGDGKVESTLSNITGLTVAVVSL